MGSVDVFEIAAPDVGNLSAVTLRHDNTGLASGWFLESVTVQNLSTGQEWTFRCSRWLARDEDDRQISRKLFSDHCE